MIVFRSAFTFASFRFLQILLPWDFLSWLWSTSLYNDLRWGICDQFFFADELPRKFFQHFTGSRCAARRLPNTCKCCVHRKVTNQGIMLVIKPMEEERAVALECRNKNTYATLRNCSCGRKVTLSHPKREHLCSVARFEGKLMLGEKKLIFCFVGTCRKCAKAKEELFGINH